jgi:hypothetical protein
MDTTDRGTVLFTANTSEFNVFGSVANPARVRNWPSRDFARNPCGRVLAVHDAAVQPYNENEFRDMF